jgi:hypothetical protein
MSKVASGDSKNSLHCSFCGKDQHEVRRLIAGQTVFICDECVELRGDILFNENESSLAKSRDGIPAPNEIRKVGAVEPAAVRVTAKTYRTTAALWQNRRDPATVLGHRRLKGSFIPHGSANC